MITHYFHVFVTGTIFIVLFLIIWKTYHHFLSLVSRVQVSNFSYQMQRLGTSIAIPYFVCLFVWSGFGEDTSGDSFAFSKEVKSINESTVESKNKTDYPPKNLNNTVIDESRNQQKNVVGNAESMSEMEEKVGYSGNDPIIRSRLGLPPKE